MLWNIGYYGYNKKDFLGKGAFGYVYRGRNNKTSKEVAIKVIDNFYLNDNYNNQKSEIEHIQGLNCKNIVRLLDHEILNGKLFLIMEPCDEDLEDRIRSVGREITEGEIRNFVRQIANGLKYLHHNNVVHRDIKPLNILIKRPQNQISYKIADFGISKIIKYAYGMTSIGNQYFMAPELVARKDSNCNVDIWSLGIIVCYMMSKNINDLDYSQHGSEELSQLISKMLELHPSNRYFAGDVLKHNFITGH